MVDQTQLDQDLRYLNLAVTEGADLRGGQRVSRPAEGFYLEPALLVGTSNRHTVNREEVFGPVALVVQSSAMTRHSPWPTTPASGSRPGSSRGPWRPSTTLSVGPPPGW